MIAGGLAATRQTIPLGPVMGQCCGGAVTLAFTPIDADTGRRLSQRLAGRAAARPKILAFGLGHTGRAFARIAAHLPYETTLVDDRPEAFRDLPEGIRALHCADPEAALAEAPAGAAILIFTHSHSLDYRLADAALRRGDASYVGMIGSATKRARFEAWFRQRGGGQAALARLTCPIGGADVADKRPEVIALLSAAEIARVFAKAREAAVRAEAVR